MSITNRELPAGSVLVAVYKKVRHTCMVELDDAGQRRYRLDDGRLFTSPSGAGSAAKDGRSCNGYDFWSIEGGQLPTGDAPGMMPEKKAKPEAGRTFKQVRKVPNQKGLEAGMNRWHCSACMKGFVLPEGETPDACPDGHAREVEAKLAPAE